MDLLVPRGWQVLLSPILFNVFARIHVNNLTQLRAINGRMVHQLQVLSALTEGLTYRLLECEERLAAQELKFQSFVDDQHDTEASVPIDDTSERLEDTEVRLAQIESLLDTSTAPCTVHRLRPVATDESSTNTSEDVLQDDYESIEDAPFLDEQEQVFQDEISA